jgi:ATP-dependent Clp protease protease subunit
MAHPARMADPGDRPDPADRPTLPERLLGRLLDRRVVLLAGPLDAGLAARVCAQLLALAARAPEPISLYLASPDGELDAAVTVMDALDTIGMPVDAVVTGHLGGPSLGVLAVADRRRAYRHATFRLAEPRVRRWGTGDQLAAEAARTIALLESLYERLARATGRPMDELRRDARAGRVLTAAEAIDYGLVESIVDRRV